MSMDTALIRQRFSAASASYDAEAEAQQHIANRLWALAAPHIGPEGTVLEIGAGTGLLTRHILDAQPRSLTVNDLYISPQVQALVREYPGRVQCVEGDAEQQDFAGPFDAVLSASTVQWFADIPAFFSRCVKVLPKGGLLAISSFLPGNLQEVAELTGVGLTYGSAAELQGQLAHHFELLAMEQGDVTLHFASPRHVLLHLRHTGVTGIRSVVWGKNSYKDFVTRYTARYGDGQGVRLTYRPVYVLAKSKGLPCGKP